MFSYANTLTNIHTHAYWQQGLRCFPSASAVHRCVALWPTSWPIWRPPPLSFPTECQMMFREGRTRSTCPLDDDGILASTVPNTLGGFSIYTSNDIYSNLFPTNDYLKCQGTPRTPCMTVPMSS